MFQPKYLKQGKLLRKGVKKFLHYKRDIIPAEKLDSIEQVAREFDEALASKNKVEIEQVAKRLTGTCEKAVPSAPNSGLRENLEVIFVAVVIAVGIRAYVLQPFKIPTGSMQPTLNGIVGYPLSEEAYLLIFETAICISIYPILQQLMALWGIRFSVFPPV